jgi:hypothetical protein
MEEVDGHGSESGRAEWEGFGAVGEILNLEAKVSDGGSRSSIGAWGGLAARLDVGGRFANGFAVLLNGLAVLGNENGFA